MLRHMELWAFGAAVCQEHDGLLHPVRFVSKVFKDADTRYTAAEQEALALLKTLHTARHYLYGQSVTVHTKYLLMKWLFTSKSLTGRAVQWAAMRTMTIIRSDQTLIGLVAVLAASLVPREKFDEVLESITPMRSVPSTTVVRPLPRLQRTSSGFLVSFDGGVRKKEPRM
ncbi:TPA: hypothetical protein N0F65_006098 [Lagenidium giganteum]|uniref:Reverse transcriptase RNase H-like domain-containing protein n=1 Tax=Lagenidium giganteum TaxID=4803 RepID=A0AAV2Z0M3_9STRA|nr:TPA: hypothetical protein N0F65_006098 [Lagenidium giganteum]